MNESILDHIESRRSKRAFLDRPVPREVIERVLFAAGRAPSAKNTQPWSVVVLGEAGCRELSRRIIAKFDRGATEPADYCYYPEPMPAEFEARAKRLGAAILALKGIDRFDKAARREHERQNWLFFGARTTLFFHLPAGAAPGTFLDLGLFIQNVVLGLLGCGVEGCLQASLMRYSRTIHEFLELGDDRLFACAMPIGYADPAAPVNAFVPERMLLEEYVVWK